MVALRWIIIVSMIVKITKLPSYELALLFMLMILILMINNDNDSYDQHMRGNPALNDDNGDLGGGEDHGNYGYMLV